MSLVSRKNLIQWYHSTFNVYLLNGRGNTESFEDKKQICQYLQLIMWRNNIVLTQPQFLDNGLTLATFFCCQPIDSLISIPLAKNQATILSSLLTWRYQLRSGIVSRTEISRNFLMTFKLIVTSHQFLQISSFFFYFKDLSYFQRHFFLLIKPQKFDTFMHL